MNKKEGDFYVDFLKMILIEKIKNIFNNKSINDYIYF